MHIEKITLEEWHQGFAVSHLPLLELPFSIEEAQLKLDFALELQWRDGLGNFLGAPCKLANQIFWFNGPVNMPDIGAIVEMRGNEADPVTLLYNICEVFGLTRDDLSWVSEFSSEPNFIVIRLDDNGNEVEMQRFHIEAEASCFAKKFEERGHKQTYSVKKAS